jgi:hypothetical protein
MIAILKGLFRPAAGPVKVDRPVDALIAARASKATTKGLRGLYLRKHAILMRRPG